jgi:hypothetical protein
MKTHFTMGIAVLAGLLLSACTPAAAGTKIFETGEPAQIPATAIPTETPSSSVSEETEAPLVQIPPKLGTAVNFGLQSLTIPPDLANGVTPSGIAPFDNEDAAWWQKTPGHFQIMLDDYILQGKFHQPVIYVYPAQAYAEMVPPAFESIHRLNNILHDPAAVLNIDQLPTVPFFNAKAVFAANIEVNAFQNGRGVRFLTQYAQYPAPVNNHELFYHYQGVTRDGAYYVIAIFPVTAPGFAETNNPSASVPPSGITYPDINEPNADWDGYYASITSLLNNTAPDAFTPALSHLDSLIQSMEIMP